jgi:hypothetical protein
MSLTDYVIETWLEQQRRNIAMRPKQPVDRLDALVVQHGNSDDFIVLQALRDKAKVVKPKLRTVKEIDTMDNFGG